MDPSHGGNLAYHGIPTSEGKRKRRPTTFDGFLTSDRQFDTFIPGRGASPEEQSQGNNVTDQSASIESGGGAAAVTASTVASAAPVAPAPAAAPVAPVVPVAAPPPPATTAAIIAAMPEHAVEPRSAPVAADTQPKRPRAKVEVKGEPLRQTRATASVHNVKKVVGVQNATRKALEWLQHGDLTLQDLAQSLPKLSKARVEVVMEALRAAGLVTLVRKHAPDALGEDHVTEVYRFSAGRSAAQALDIGGGKSVALGSISKRIKASEAEIAALNERINVLKTEAAKADPQPQLVLDILRDFMKQDKSLDEDPFYSVAYKATCAAAAKAAKVVAIARAASIADADRTAKAASQAKKKAADNALAAAAAAESKRVAAVAAANAAVTAAATAAAAEAAVAATSANVSVTTYCEASGQSLVSVPAAVSALPAAAGSFGAAPAAPAGYPPAAAAAVPEGYVEALVGVGGEQEETA